MSRLSEQNEILMPRIERIIPGARNALRDFLRARFPSVNRRISTFHLSEDRQFLETRILTYLRDEQAINRILFVGCDWYTKHYERFFKSKDYWTLEIDPAKRQYGARQHIVDALRNLEQHVPRDYFDAIVCNGVFMKTAIETREEAEPSFQACIGCLRKGGWYILGWNDTDELRPYPPSESAALRVLVRTAFPSVGTSEHRTDTSYRHTYTFFNKP
jgi:hypothetical protein